MNHFESVSQGILNYLEEWEPKLLQLPQNVFTQRRNSQNRNIKQIIGHMVDSASNNTHRVVHLQYQESPLTYPNYATFGNNDRWIAIQNYQEENWEDLIQLWKYSNIHYAYIINYVDPSKLENQWDTGEGNLVTLNDMIVDYLRHFELHLDEMDELINQ